MACYRCVVVITADREPVREPIGVASAVARWRVSEAASSTSSIRGSSVECARRTDPHQDRAGCLRLPQRNSELGGGILAPTASTSMSP